MDEDELWLSEEEDDECGVSTDPAFFSLALTYQGQPGEFRVRNRPGQLQRKAISVFHGGTKRKPTFTVSCNAKAIIHGEMGPSSSSAATLLVYKFEFISYRGARIKEANILLEFCNRKNGQTAGGPSVVGVRPHGLHKMIETAQTETSRLGMELNVGSTDAALKIAGEEGVEKTTKHYTVVSGDAPQDDWGNQFQAWFSLAENESQKSGIPSELTACILLERDDDEDFECVPYIDATPDFRTMVASLFSTRAPDDPIVFNPKEAPFNKLDGVVGIDLNNLGATDLDKLWDCTMHYTHDEAVKKTKSTD